MRVRWFNAGTRPPKMGRLLHNAKLSFALQHTEWTLLEDLLAYGITELNPGDFVLRGTCFFVAMDAEPAPKSPLVKAAATKCQWGSSLERRVSCDALGRPAPAPRSRLVDAEGSKTAHGGWLGWLWSA